MSSNDVCMVYIADLTEYNHGNLMGEWFDLENDPDAMEKYIDSILSWDHEWAIHDHSGWYGLNPAELSVECMIEIGQKDECEREAICLWLNNTGYHKTNPDDFMDKFKDAYRGVWEKVEDYAYEYINDVYDLDKTMGSLAMYFDYEAFARDMQLGGDICAIDGSHGVHICDNHI